MITLGWDEQTRISLVPRATAYFIAQGSFQKTVLFIQDCCKKVPETGGLNNRSYPLTLLEAASLRLRWWWGLFLLRVLSEGSIPGLSDWLGDGCLLHMSSGHLSSL